MHVNLHLYDVSLCTLRTNFYSRFNGRGVRASYAHLDYSPSQSGQMHAKRHASRRLEMPGPAYACRYLYDVEVWKIIRERERERGEQWKEAEIEEGGEEEVKCRHTIHPQALNPIT